MEEYDSGRIPEILRSFRKVAVVGISEKPDRDSYRVSKYLMEHGYTIYPVNPALKEWNGLRAYPDLKSIPRGEGIEIIDIFRKSEAVPDIVKESVGLAPRVIWMQEGVVSGEGARLAKSHGMRVGMDHCIMKERARIRD